MKMHSQHASDATAFIKHHPHHRHPPTSTPTPPPPDTVELFSCIPLNILYFTFKNTKQMKKSCKY